MGKVIKLHDERWVEGIFNEGGLRVDVSTKGNVRFVQEYMSRDHVAEAAATISMEQMSRLGEAISIAFKEDDDG